MTNIRILPKGAASPEDIKFDSRLWDKVHSMEKQVVGLQQRLLRRAQRHYVAPRGARGFLGFRGARGPTVVGKPGYPGVPGKSVIGAPGRQGNRGARGQDTRGAPGWSGTGGKDVRGPPGPPGIMGRQGPPGRSLPGDVGRRGRQGKIGDVGKRGIRGPLGAPGPVGRRGRPGLVGLPGKPGELIIERQIITKNVVNQPCLMTDWQKTIGVSGGWSYCPTGMALRGVYSSGGKSVDKLKTAKCCGKSDSFVLLSQCKQVFWYNTMKAQGWSTCPVGQYLVGLRHAKTSKQTMSSINQGTCCRYKKEKAWGACKTVSAHLHQAGWSECPAGYFAAGFYRTAASSVADDLSVVGRLKCCRPKV